MAAHPCHLAEPRHPAWRLDRHGDRPVMELPPAGEVLALLARRGYRLIPDDIHLLWHVVWSADLCDPGARWVCVGVVCQPDEAVRELEAAGWPREPWPDGWACPTHAH